jgi:hypothetical protein
MGSPSGYVHTKLMVQNGLAGLALAILTETRL